MAVTRPMVTCGRNGVEWLDGAKILFVTIVLFVEICKNVYG